jgi:hypothetical protein
MKPPPYNISAFWHNDQDDGIAVMFQGGDLVAIKHKIALACEDMDQPDHEHSGILLARLAEYASRRDKLSFYEQVEVACLIAALQHHGVIKDDNHNGLLIMREVVPDSHSIPDGQHRTIH